MLLFFELLLTGTYQGVDIQPQKIRLGIYAKMLSHAESEASSK